MSPTKPDPSLIPLVGFFSPAIDGTLVSLINTATPGHPEREALSVGGLAEQRFIALELLEKDDVDQRHALAERIAREHAAHGKPFGLYLRNFVLGARVVAGQKDRWGANRLLTLASGDDMIMQGLIDEQATAHAVPFVTIANPAMNMGPIPSLVFSDENWAGAAEPLIRHAAVVVLFFLTSTHGVDQEIDLLRAAGAIDRTLIVVAENDPRTDSMDHVMRQLFASLTQSEAADPSQPAVAEPPPPEIRSPPADFPRQIRLEGQPEDWMVSVKEALSDLLGRATPSTAGELPPLPPQDRPSRDVLDLAHARALKEVDLAGELFSKGDGVAAEDALVRSIAFSHWARDPLGRAIAFTQLGSVERFLLKYPNEAVTSYLIAMDLFEPLLSLSETASKLYPAVADQLASYLEELGDSKRAQYVRDRLGKHQVNS